ncbi:MAG: DUF624 domain-containing protein [Clostridia bacterium]|nr:DUF624 domain-containing protein [Clostridia bacterium]
MRLPKYRLFDYTTPGKGVSKDEPKKTGIALFFDILGRRFWKFVNLNALYLLFSIPTFIIDWFGMYVVLTFALSQSMESLGAEDYASMITRLCIFCTLILYSLFGGGPATAGMTYVVRNYREDTHAWVWSDFKSAMLSNFKRATAVYVIDTIFLFLLGINCWFYGEFAGSSIAAYLLQGLMIMLFFIFVLMHAYIYPIMISFDMKVWDIYKNSFLLAMGKLPTTFLSMLCCFLFCGIISWAACYVIVYAALLVPILMFALTAYINLFMTYPIVKRYLAKGAKDE